MILTMILHLMVQRGDLLGQFTKKIERSLPPVPALPNQRRTHGKIFASTSPTSGSPQQLLSHIEAGTPLGIIVAGDLAGNIHLK